MIMDCDYIMDSKSQFYIVRGYWNDKGVLTNKVFQPKVDGDRFNNITNKNYEKVIENNHIPLKLYDVKKIFCPRKKLKEEYEGLNETIWHNLIKELSKIIPIDDIGIIGSYLIGFDVKKDVDIVVYGKENCRKLRENVKKLHKNLGTTPITKQHIIYQIKKHGRNYSEFNTFDKLLCNKWSSFQVREGILSTVRFVYKENEIPVNPFSKKILKEIEIKGKVIDDLGSNFSPRTFIIKTDSGDYTIATYFWIYQSCVKDGMNVFVKGNLREGNIVTLDEFSHGIK